MSELRDRIAAVVRREVPCHPPAADRIADAVIAELGLEREHSFSRPGWEGATLHRYVTDWMANDE